MKETVSKQPNSLEVAQADIEIDINNVESYIKDVKSVVISESGPISNDMRYELPNGKLVTAQETEYLPGKEKTKPFKLSGEGSLIIQTREKEQSTVEIYERLRDKLINYQAILKFLTEKNSETEPMDYDDYFEKINGLTRFEITKELEFNARSRFKEVYIKVLNKLESKERKTSSDNIEELKKYGDRLHLKDRITSNFYQIPSLYELTASALKETKKIIQENNITKENVLDTIQKMKKKQLKPNKKTNPLLYIAWLVNSFSNPDNYSGKDRASKEAQASVSQELATELYFGPKSILEIKKELKNDRESVVQRISEAEKNHKKKIAQKYSAKQENIKYIFASGYGKKSQKYLDEKDIEGIKKIINDEEFTYVKKLLNEELVKRIQYLIQTQKRQS